MFSFRQILISLFTFFLILEFHICLCKLVSVRLDSKWPSPPLLLELRYITIFKQIIYLELNSTIELLKY